MWDRNGQSQFWSLNQLIDHMEKVKPIRSPKNCQSAVEEGEIADEQQVELRKMVEEGRRLKLLARQSAKVAKQSVKEMKSNRKRPLSIIKVRHFIWAFPLKL